MGIRIMLSLVFILGSVAGLAYVTVASGDEVDAAHLLIFFTMALGAWGAILLLIPMFRTLFSAPAPRRPLPSKKR